MEREEVVLDASVVVKWFVEEGYSREARLLRDLLLKEINLDPGSDLDLMLSWRSFSLEQLMSA